MATVQETLASLPSLNDVIQNAEAQHSKDDYTITMLDNQTTLMFFEDGAGNEFSFIYNKAQEYGFLLIFDHETPFNTCSEAEPNIQIALEDLPEKYVSISTTPNLFWSWAVNPQKVYATAAIWWNENIWQVNPNWKQETTEQNNDGGLNWATKKFIPTA